MRTLTNVPSVTYEESVAKEELEVSFALTVPRTPGDNLEMTVHAGDSLFLLGANGAGKSGLIHSFYLAHRAHARRISAHRQTWFESGGITLTAEGRRNTESNVQSQDAQPSARWKEEYSQQRASMAIYDLLDAENVRARGITGAVDGDNFDLAKELSKKDAPIRIINELLRLSNMPIEISVREAEQIVASKAGGQQYSIAELSDGERNGLLIAANVLTVKPGTLILIDEPERHLHRSIISPLLSLLFARRPDCAFIVSTHEVMLAVDNPRARTLLVRSCVYTKSSPTAWVADLLPPDTELDDEIRKDILGSRRNVVFVEGVDRSLDKPLYSILFPTASVLAKKSCRDVEHSVAGVRDTGAVHWAQAFGIIDNDGRLAQEIAQLKARGVYALAVFSVESIYYHPEIQRKVAERYSLVTGENATERLAAAKAAALDAVKPHVQRLSERAAERSIREEVFSKLPKREDIATAAPISIAIDVAVRVAAEVDRLLAALDAADLTAIISRYPIRETPALGRISAKLGFQRTEQYESAVRKLLMDDVEALTFVRALFGNLAADLAAA